MTNLRALMCATLGFAALAAACGGESSKATPAPVTTNTAAPSLQTPLPPGEATPTPTPEYTGSLRIGVWVRVEGSGDCLNFRLYPGVENSHTGPPINFCQPDGFVGYVSAGPVFSDGHWWWGIAGQGWAVEDFLVLHDLENLDKKVVPQLAGLGKIALWDIDSGIWVMNSDGSDRRELVDIERISTPDENISVSDLRWAPDGQGLSFSVSSWTRGGGVQDVVRVIDLEGRQQLEIQQATAASWSPDGDSLAFVAEMSHGPMEVEGVPSVMNLATAETRAIGDQGWFSEGPRWSPNGSVLAWADTSAIHLAASDGSWHRLVLEAGAEGYGWAVNWSPMGNMLSFFEKRGGDVIGFIVYDVLAGRVLTAIQPYPSGQDPRRCQKHASNETFQTDWMPDGKALIFHGECGYTGENGVWIVDIATGERRLIPTENASYVDVASDGRHLVFQAWANSIWVADLDGSPPVLLAEGSMPVWQPQPR